MIFKIAAKNILRNKRRTFLTSLAMILGISSLLIFGSFISEQMKGFRQSVIREGLGHIQLASDADYFSRGKFDSEEFAIKKWSEIENTLSGTTEIKSIIKSAGFTAMAAGSEKTITLLVKAYPAENIRFASNQDERVEEQISPSFLVEGNNFSEGTNPIIIGDMAAKILSVKTGSTITLMSVKKNGTLNAEDFTVSGIYKGGESGKIYAYIPYKSAENLLGISAPTCYTLFLHDEYATEQTAAALAQKLPELSIKKWNELADFYTQVNGMYNSFLAVISLILTIVTVFVIMNTMSMCVFERMRELGTMRAVGTKRSKIFAMLLSEGFFLGIFGSAGGICAGYLLIFLINLAGGIPFSYDGFTYHIKLYPELKDAAESALPVILVSIAGTLPAAVKASKLSIAETLRY